MYNSSESLYEIDELCSESGSKKIKYSGKCRHNLYSDTIISTVKTDFSRDEQNTMKNFSEQLVLSKKDDHIIEIMSRGN